jgi:hypothetical protein
MASCPSYNLRQDRTSRRVHGLYIHQYRPTASCRRQGIYDLLGSTAIQLNALVLVQNLPLYGDSGCVDYLTTVLNQSLHGVARPRMLYAPVMRIPKSY